MLFFFALCWLDVNSIVPFNTKRVRCECVCLCSLHFRTSMHWLVFIVVIHRFKLLNSPWVPLCHVIPPFQPKVLSTQRKQKKNCSLLFFRFLCVHCAFAFVMCMIFFLIYLSQSCSLSNPPPQPGSNNIQTLFLLQNNISLLIKLANKYPKHSLPLRSHNASLLETSKRSLLFNYPIK